MHTSPVQTFHESGADVVISTHTKKPLARDQKTEQLISEGWNERKKWRPELTVSTLLRVTEIKETKEGLQVHTQADITYKDVVGLRYHRGRLAELPTASTFQALTLMLHVRTADGESIFLERDSGDWEHSLEFPGMFVRANGVEVEAKQHVETLLAKDLGIDSGALAQTRLFSVLDFNDICEKMLIYQVDLDIKTDELAAHASKALFSIPHGYTGDAHDQFFKLPLHYPTAEVISHMRATKPDEFVL